MLRTDLAVESAADLKDEKGVKREEETCSGMNICRMDVISERAAKELGKPRGAATDWIPCAAWRSLRPACSDKRAWKRRNC